MKCPKCGYSSFDYNLICPKCNKDIAIEQGKINIPPFKPAPPVLLGGLTGEESEASEVSLQDEPAGVLNSEGHGVDIDLDDSLVLDTNKMKSNEDELTIDLNDPNDIGTPNEPEMSLDEPVETLEQEDDELTLDLDNISFDELESDDSLDESQEIVLSSEDEDDKELTLDLDDTVLEEPVADESLDESQEIVLSSEEEDEELNLDLDDTTIEDMETDDSLNKTQGILLSSMGDIDGKANLDLDDTTIEEPTEMDGSLNASQEITLSSEEEELNLDLDDTLSNESKPDDFPVADSDGIEIEDIPQEDEVPKLEQDEISEDTEETSQETESTPFISEEKSENEIFGEEDHSQNDSQEQNISSDSEKIKEVATDLDSTLTEESEAEDISDAISNDIKTEEALREDEVAKLEQDGTETQDIISVDTENIASEEILLTDAVTEEIEDSISEKTISTDDIPQEETVESTTDHNEISNDENLDTDNNDVSFDDTVFLSLQKGTEKEPVSEEPNIDFNEASFDDTASLDLDRIISDDSTIKGDPKVEHDETYTGVNQATDEGGISFDDTVFLQLKKDAKKEQHQMDDADTDIDEISFDDTASLDLDGIISDDSNDKGESKLKLGETYTGVSQETDEGGMSFDDTVFLQLQKDAEKVNISSNIEPQDVNPEADNDEISFDDTASLDLEGIVSEDETREPVTASTENKTEDSIMDGSGSEIRINLDDLQINKTGELEIKIEDESNEDQKDQSVILDSTQVLNPEDITFDIPDFEDTANKEDDDAQLEVNIDPNDENIDLENIDLDIDLDNTKNK